MQPSAKHHIHIQAIENFLQNAESKKRRKPDKTAFSIQQLLRSWLVRLLSDLFFVFVEVLSLFWKESLLQRLLRFLKNGNKVKAEALGTMLDVPRNQDLDRYISCKSHSLEES